MGDPISSIGNWLEGILLGWGLPAGLVSAILALIGVVVMCTLLLVLDIILVWVERKVVARFQDRLGPNRLGPFGLIQPFADIIKLLIKEDITPAGADKIVFNIPPIIALATVLLLWAVIPLAPTVLGGDINVAVLFIVAVGAVGSLGILMAGWASNNKYALIGAFRTVAQIISYEVPMLIALLIPVILARSMSLQTIVGAQDVWFIFVIPVAAVIFFISSIAELGRAPFDINEAESEIVAGFHIEYTGMKFGMFYAGELLHAVTVSAVFSTLFLGGWRGPFAEQVPLLGIFYLLAKAFILYYVIMWVRYSFPRLRIDQMLGFSWKFLIPLSLGLLIVTAILDKLLVTTFQVQPSTPLYAIIMLLMNVIITLITVLGLRSYAQLQRKRFSEDRPVAIAPEADFKELIAQE